jgi:hypothetical protein
MSEELQAWYYMVDGEQVGPIAAEDLQQLAMNGTIHAESELWTEGLDQWIPATNVEGLLPVEPVPEPAQPAPGKPRLVVGAAAQAAHPLAGEIVPQAPTSQATPLQAAPLQAAPLQAAPLQAAPGGQAVAGVVQPAGYQPVGMQSAGMAMAAAVAPGMEYPSAGVKRASFGLFLGMLLGGFGLIIIAFIVAGGILSEGGEDLESTGAAAFFGLAGIGFILFIIGGILQYVYLYRAWACLRFGGPRTTPGKAIGFLFIPFFNIYWVFVAIYGLAQDWNRIMSSHPNLQGAPRMSEGMFLAFLICNLVFFPVGLILCVIVYSQICAGINFMAPQNLRQAQPAGMSFY